MSKRIAFNEELCTNCQLCAMYCSLGFSRKGVFEFRPSIARIRVGENEDGTKFVAHVCLQCQYPLCMEVCPVEAISKERETGVVMIDYEACTGCGECVEACEFDCIFIVDGRAVKCEVCDDQRCVHACTVKALEVVDDNNVEEQGKLYKEVKL